jgi:hypothetical protein
MKKLIIILNLLIGFTAIIYSQNINGRFTSGLYTFERFDSTGSSATHARTYQMLYLTFGNKNVSLVTSLNLEGDIAEKISYDPRLRVNNLYLDVKKLFNVVYLKLGRQTLFNSIGGGLFDGVTLGLKCSGIDINGYYGGNTPAYQKLKFTDDLNNDYVAGGKITVSSLKNTRFAFKYINKNFKSPSYTAIRLDADLNPITYLIENNSVQYEYISGEVSYDQPSSFRIDSRYDYDINFKTNSKFEISCRVEGSKNFGLSAYYNYREPRVRYNSIFSVFDYGNSREIEIGSDYSFSDGISLNGKFAHVSYKDDNSQRLSVGMSSKWGSISARKTFGYAGELNAVSVYTAHSFLEGLLTPSFSLGFTSYKLSASDEKNDMISVLLGLNYRPIRTFSLDTQAQYMNNKIYSNDFRLLLKLNFWFNTNL